MDNTRNLMCPRRLSNRRLRRRFPAVRWPALIGLLILPSLAGCDSGPKLAPVAGKITFRGQAVGPGDILFIPDKQQGTRGKAARGSFGADGVYALTTLEPGDGAIVGRHRVFITPRPQGFPPGAEFPQNHPGLPPIPYKYGYRGRPILEAEVVDGENDLDFDLQP